ncbi:MAG: alpha/beta hydrolase family protein [Corynebacterium sp.]|nr:alpha/beta hydrolase family protein [Corynebacterium sp.]
MTKRVSRIRRGLVATCVAAATMLSGAMSVAVAQEINYPSAEPAQPATLRQESQDEPPKEGPTQRWRQMIGGLADNGDGQYELDANGKAKFRAGSTPAMQARGVYVYEATSPAMDGRKIPLVVIKANDTSQGPRPTLYVLNGGDGGEGAANWIMQTPALEYYASKNINVVVPMSGQFSYYSDWANTPKNTALGGKQMWETFLTKELPGVIEKELGASGKRAITGMSMSATTVLLFAQHHPGFYDAIGSFSGCAQTNGGMGKIAIDLTLNRANSNLGEIWGTGGAFQPGWSTEPIPNYLAYNDALINAEKLRGQKMYISNGSGLSGRWDFWSSPRTQGNSAAMAEVQVTGGIIEAATNLCTHDLKAKLDKAGIPADWNFHATGTHQWGYWTDDMYQSWPTLAAGLGIGNEVAPADTQGA